MHAVSTKIHRRVDPKTAQKIARVRKSNRKSTSSITSHAIEQLSEPAPRKTTAELFGDFIGCFSAGGHRREGDRSNQSPMP